MTQSAQMNLTAKAVNGVFLGVVAAFCPLAGTSGQTTIKTEVESAIVWSGPQCRESETWLGGHEALCDGIPSAHPEASSLVQDPLTGESLRKLNYQGVEVISELQTYPLGCGWSECYEAYVASFTIINNTESPLDLNGNSFNSTLRFPTAREIRKWWGKKVNPSDFAPASGTIQAGRSARVSAVMVGRQGTTNITKWWNHSPVGVLPIRYSIKLRGKDFVFPWLAPTVGTFKRVPQWDY